VPRPGLCAVKFGILTGVSTAQSRLTDSMQPLSEIARYTTAVEELGFHSIFLIEHHFTGTGQVASTLAVLSYLAGITRRIRLGTGVAVLPWHNPVLLAEQLATLDQISHGRLDVGVGRGYRPTEFAGFGISPEEAHARSEETYSFLRRAWTTHERFSHRGQFWSFDDIIIDPKVFQQPHPPIWLAASSLASIRRAGAEDMNLLLDQIAPPRLIFERVNAFREARIESGQAYDPESVCVSRTFQVTTSKAEREAALAHRTQLLADFRRIAGSESALFAHMLPSFSDSRLTESDSSIIGYPDELVERLKQLHEGGVEYVMLADISGDLRGLETFMKQVVPAFEASVRNTSTISKQ
jgi:alkanesulfonate monooxygenase SsuD/methylene tetrahydromethanopterin reductase-like flavin-dependent oxidoreductase (luciferase family)